MIRLTLEKRNRENDKESIKKMAEANQFAEDLRIPKSYSAYLDESEGILLCRVYDKENEKFEDIDMKKFNFEWKKLKKLVAVNYF
jgi:hypothetical protein